MATLALQKRNYAQSTRTYILLIIVTLILGGYYGFTQYMKFSGAQNAVTTEQVKITELQATQSQTSSDYANLKKAFSQKFSDILDSLQTVYPVEEKYTDLARL